MRVITTSLARKDIIESAEYIAQDNTDAAFRFLDAVETTIQLIKVTPSIGKLRPIGGEKGLRTWFVNGFPKYLVFYKTTKSEIRIVRVLYSSRDYEALISG